jgi:hypothetical protein
VLTYGCLPTGLKPFLSCPYLPKCLEGLLSEVRQAAAATDPNFAKSLSGVFSHLTQHQLERLRPYPEIRAERAIEYKDREED